VVQFFGTLSANNSTTGLAQNGISPCPGREKSIPVPDLRIVWMRLGLPQKVTEESVPGRLLGRVRISSPGYGPPKVIRPRDVNVEKTLKDEPQKE
jgi:hypothetical protein